MPTPRFRDIPRFTRQADYRVDFSWSSLLATLEEFTTESRLILCPDFQRGHVWTEAQQVAFVEFMLRGGASARDIYFNSPSWHSVAQPPAGAYDEFVCVDGLQRLTAACRFLRNEIPAFGAYRQDYADLLPREVRFTFHVNNLPTRAAVLQWYLEFNSGGTPHAEAELARVRALLEDARASTR